VRIEEGRIEKRILVVEDDAPFRKEFTRALQRALVADPLDVTFVEACSLAKARARLREGWTSCMS
jgi:ActR/RegA family two-component response regulator